MTYLSGRPTLALLGTGIRNILTTPTVQTAKLYAATNGQFPAKDTSALLTGRIDHTFGDSDTGFMRLNYTKTRSENDATGALNAVSRGRQVKSPSGGILLSENHISITQPSTKPAHNFLITD